MADQACFLNSYYPDYSVGDSGRGYWPVTYEPSERLNAGRDPAHPDYIFSQLHGVLEVWQPSKRLATLDRFSNRLKESKVSGSDLAIAYLKEKYNQNMATATLSQSGGVIHSFLLLLHESGRDFHQLTSKDIGKFVERDLDNGLKSGAIRTKLQALYAFIRFLVDQEILSYELLHKRIRIKREEPLPKAIAAQDIKSLLLARISHEHCVNFHKSSDISMWSSSIPSYENHTQCSPKASRSYHACSVAEARRIDYYSTLLRASHPRQPRLVRNPG